MNALVEKQIIAQRLLIPQNIQAILWDMDGVLLDSLGLDIKVCNQLLSQYFGDYVKVTNGFIRSIFAYHPQKFWRLILTHVEENYKIHDALNQHESILLGYEMIRRKSVFKPNPGILEILSEVKPRVSKMAVVSNNPTEDVKSILRQSGILDYFDVIIGNDVEGLEKKPAPDTYIFAAKILDVKPENCVVVEDSLIGMEAGYRANCHTIGVATGGIDYNVLAQSQWTHQTYSSFDAQYLNIQFGNVQKKHIVTLNDFVSHMIEHIAWRLCVEIQLKWNNNDWLELGKFIGQRILEFDVYKQSAAALGMIDDGSAEVTVDIAEKESGLVLSSTDNLDLNWFLSLRCEQLQSGSPLIALMQGLALGLSAKIKVKICSVEDPHHAWEGVFRSIGIALNRIFTPKHPVVLPVDYSVEESAATGELQVLAKSLHYSKVLRGTAESYVAVSVDFSKQLENRFIFNVAPNIDVTELPRLLECLAGEAGFTLQVEFNSTVLSSSHVVLEDTALVLGRALLEILILRMIHWGVNGAGSSVQSIDDVSSQPIRVGLSVEGRKCWLFVPFKDSPDTIRKKFIIGQNIYDHLRSEDLDDFLDGLSGGLGCSIIVHIQELIEADKGWQLLFTNLGKSLNEVFALNPYRKGVPPGVKATLA